MADHSVVLSPVSFDPLKRAALALLAKAGEFAAPGRVESQLEQELLNRFDGAAITPASVLSWLESLGGVAYHDLDSLIQQFATNPAALHQALQAQNDAGGVVLLQVAHASQLVEAASGAALHAGQDVAHWLLRTGYSDDQGYGMYYDLSAAGQPQPVHIPWQSIINAGITAAIALDAPKIPLDREALASTLTGIEGGIASVEAHIEGIKSAFAEHLQAASDALAGVKAAHASILSQL